MTAADISENPQALSRIKARRDFLRAARGKTVAMPGLVLQARARLSPEGPPRSGFTVTKKIGNAVARNRARRRLRAAAAAVLPGRAKPGWDYVLIGRAETLTRTFALLISDLEGALKRLDRPAKPRRERKS
jgi:ribonuclease P protein component